jgi:hypothetical protein
MLYEGKILDGRNRYNACIAAGVEPRYIDYEGHDPTPYVVSLNLKRRHLNESQRAMIAATIANMRQGARTDLAPSASLPEVSQAAAAELMNVSERSVRNARTVRDNGLQQVVAAVEQGRISVSAAAQFTRVNEPDQQAAIIEQHGSVAAAVQLARPSEKAIRKLLKESFKLRSAKEFKGSIYDVAGWLHHEEWDDDDCRVGPETLWEYLTIAGEDHAEWPAVLDDAIKTLRAIKRAMPQTA